MTYHRVCNYINTTGATSGAGTADPSASNRQNSFKIKKKNRGNVEFNLD